MGAFSPTGATVNLAVTGTAQTLTITSPSGALSAIVRIANIGTQTVFMRFDGTTATASNAMAVLANSVEVFDMGSATVISAIAANTGSTLYVTTGMGD